MNLDQIATDASRDARQAAAREMPIVPIGRLRRRRLLLTNHTIGRRRTGGLGRHPRVFAAF